MRGKSLLIALMTIMLLAMGFDAAGAAVGADLGFVVSLVLSASLTVVVQVAMLPFKV
jgi:hypothetical protein